MAIGVDLQSARDAFLRRHGETRQSLNGRDWGLIRVGVAGPALVLLPGTLGRADIFWQQLDALEGSARVMAMSYPAGGGIADWADDIALAMDAAGFAGATVLGSSLGGYVAQYLAATRADMVGGLVAANTLPGTTGIDRIPPYSLDLEATPIGDLRAGFEGGLKQWAVAGHPYAELAGLLLQEVAGRIPEGEMRARLQALKTAPPLPAQTLPNARISTVESDDDHLIAPPVRAALRAALQPGRAFRFRAASHFPYVTRPDAYSALLREVLGLKAPGAYWPEGGETLL